MAPRSLRGPVCLVALPLGLALLGLATLPVLGHGPDGGGPPWAEEGWGPSTAPAVTDPGPPAVALVLVAAAGLLLRRRRPEAALVVTAGATGAYLALGHPYGPILLTLAVAVYAIARRLPLLPALLWAGGALVLLVLLLLTRSGALASLLPAAPWFALPFTIGLVARQNHEARARARAEADRRLVEAERLRVAQEVHDVVGHGLAAIQMQADIALHVRESNPDQPVQALRAISAASEEALVELRTTLTGVRAQTTPTPGLARVAELCRRVRDTGVEVELRVEGRADLPGPVDLAAYRIVQESLTNVVRHSRHPRAQVLVRHRPDRLELSITNPVDRAVSPVPGLGIDGMRRRAEQLGGSLTAGPRDADDAPGVFTVHAQLPTKEER